MGDSKEGRGSLHCGPTAAAARLQSSGAPSDYPHPYPHPHFGSIPESPSCRNERPEPPEHHAAGEQHGAALESEPCSWKLLP